MHQLPLPRTVRGRALLRLPMILTDRRGPTPRRLRSLGRSRNTPAAQDVRSYPTYPLQRDSLSVTIAANPHPKAATPSAPLRVRWEPLQGHRAHARWHKCDSLPTVEQPISFYQILMNNRERVSTYSVAATSPVGGL